MMESMDMRETPPVPVLSTTLGLDDVAIARLWLGKPTQQWNNLHLVEQWEQMFAQWLGVHTVTAWLGGRASLYAAIEALGLQAGDEVILPAFTCQCVVNAFSFHGIEVRYADIEAQTYGMEAVSAAQAITPRTKAILLQYTFGLVSRDIEALLDLAHKHHLYVIEDCAHALGASWQGKPVGTFGDLAIFSSERSKIINTIHGGMVTTNSPEIAERLKALTQQALLPDPEKTRKLLNTVIHNYYVYADPDRRQHAELVEKKYTGQILPQMFPEEFEGIFIPHYTERINAPIAALSLNQFSKIQYFHLRRMKAAQHWDRWCDQNGYQKPLVIENSEPAFLRYPVCISEEKKRNLEWVEQELNVTPGVWFTSAAHPKPLELVHCPVGAKAARECINLPTLLPEDYECKYSQSP